MTTPAELEHLAKLELEERAEDDARPESDDWHEWLTEDPTPPREDPRRDVEY